MESIEDAGATDRDAFSGIFGDERGPTQVTLGLCQVELFMQDDLRLCGPMRKNDDVDEHFD